ncbi:MAG: hypothetical protein WCI72_02975 [archaeon]
MKERISATVEAETIKTIERILKNKKFRNKSHVIESAIDSFAKLEVKNGN